MPLADLSHCGVFPRTSGFQQTPSLAPAASSLRNWRPRSPA